MQRVPIGKFQFHSNATTNVTETMKIDLHLELCIVVHAEIDDFLFQKTTNQRETRDGDISKIIIV